MSDRDQAAEASSVEAAATPLRAASRQLGRVFSSPFGDVPGPLRPHRLPDMGLDEPVTAGQERGMRAFWWDGFWANSAETIIVNYLGLYLLAFGASNSQVGLLSSLSSLFAAAAFVPFVADGNTAIWIIIGLASFRGFWGYFAVPAWTSLTADIVPLGIRGRFLASRNFGMSISALATAPLAGFLIDHYSGLHGWQLVWLIAFVTGALSTWCYAQIPEPAPHPQVVAMQEEPDRPSFLSDILSDRNFVMYLLSTGIWNIALMSAGPFFNVYLVENLHSSTAMVGFLNSLIALTGLLGVVYFGRMMDRRGTKWVMGVNGLLIPLLPAAWIFVTAAWQVTFINIFGGLIWAGYTLALMNMVMVMAPRGKRARYAAAFQTVTFAGAFLGPILGGFVIDAVGFKAVFLISAIGRMTSSVILLRFVKLSADDHADA